MSLRAIFGPRGSVGLSRWALLLALQVGVGACGSEEPPPVTVAKRFAAAVQAGDVEQVLELVDAHARARLTEAAQSASDQVGGRRAVAPHEMLQVVDADPIFQVKQAELDRGDDTTATVILTGADGTKHELFLVAEDGDWKVRVLSPPTTTEES